MSGMIKDNIDNFVTHIFVEDNETDTVRNLKVDDLPSVKIVKCKWIEECFQSGQVCDITNYLIDY